MKNTKNSVQRPHPGMADAQDEGMESRESTVLTILMKFYNLIKLKTNSIKLFIRKIIILDKIIIIEWNQFFK